MTFRSLRHLSVLVWLAISVKATHAASPGLSLPDAAKAGDLAQVEALLAQGADPNAPDAEGMSALHRAAAEGHADVARFLLDHKAAIDAQEGKFQETPLTEAAQFGRLEVVKLLLERGAKLELKGKYGGTALTSVVNNVGVASAKTSEAQVYEIIRLLLAHGADPNSQNEGGETMLFMPAYSNDVKLVSTLVKGKIKPGILNKSGDTALDYACRGKGDVEMFDILTRAGFKPAQGLEGCLQGAVQESKLKLVARLLPLVPPPPTLLGAAAAGHGADDEKIGLLILASGADANAPSIMKVSPLHGAALTGKVQLTAALLRKGASLTATSSYFTDGTPLHFAARFGNPEIVAQLLKAGASADAKNEYGDTPLLAAVQGPIDYQPSDGPPPDWSKAGAYLKTIELLIARRADPGVRNRQGKSATDLLEHVSNEDFKSRARALLRNRP